MEFRILGPVEVVHEGRSLPLGGSRERGVLALLLSSANQVVSVDRLAADLWGESPPDDGGVQALRVFVSRLRKVLRDAGEDTVLLTKSPGYMARVDDAALDAARFEALLAAGRGQSRCGDHDGAARTLRQALDLWRGPALADVVDAPFARTEAARLEEGRLAALEERIEADLACGRHGELVSDLEALTRDHPLRERFWAQRMVALYRSGRQAEALRAYRDLRTVLGDELGIEPSVPLARLEVAILRHEPAVQWPPEDPVPIFGRARPPHHLPVVPGPFVGRRRERDAVARLLKERNLVTLVGPGGAGKTRLAIEVAADVAVGFPDGVFFVDLAPLKEATQVVSRVVASLRIVVDGIDGDAAGGGLRRLVEHLRDRRVLLVLDNCEHLLEEAANLIDHVLRNCPWTRLLATSREALAVPGESVWPVPPMSLPGPDEGVAEVTPASDAMALFYERAAAVDPGFRPGPDNAAAVARICRRLDGSPLALELAAARVRVLTPDELEARLDDRLRLLTGGARTAASRHQTLRAALDWGHDLLTEPERALLFRLAAFRGSFALDAAEAVGADGELVSASDVLDLVGRLVDKSWISVERGRTSRYRLSETIRQYAEEKLVASGDEDATRRRHCAHYLGVVTEKRAALLHPGEWLARLRVEDDNLRAALEWSFSAGENIAALRFAAGLFFYWYMSGQLVEGIAWLERSLAATPSVRRPARVGALNGLGMLRRQLGDRQGTLRIHEEARVLAREIGDAVGEAVSMIAPAQLALARGDLAEARSLLEAARQILQEQGLPGSAAWAEYDLGWVELGAGDAESAALFFQRALHGQGHGPAGNMAASAGSALALTAALRGDAAGFLEWAATAFEAARSIGLPEIPMMTLARVSEAAVVLGDYDRARRTLREALRLVSDVGGRAYVAPLLELTAIVRSPTTGGSSSTVRLLGAAETIRELTSEPFRPPHLQGNFDRCVSEARRAVGEAEVAAQWAHGRRLEPAEAVALALGHLESEDREHLRL